MPGERPTEGSTVAVMRILETSIWLLAALHLLQGYGLYYADALTRVAYLIRRIDLCWDDLPRTNVLLLDSILCVVRCKSPPRRVGLARCYNTPTAVRPRSCISWHIEQLGRQHLLFARTCHSPFAHGPLPEEVNPWTCRGVHNGQRAQTRTEAGGYVLVGSGGNSRGLRRAMLPTLACRVSGQQHATAAEQQQQQQQHCHTVAPSYHTLCAQRVAAQDACS